MYSLFQAAVRPGLGADKVAIVLRNLMHRLGFKQYYIQGGDWGALIVSIMATLFPDVSTVIQASVCIDSVEMYF